RRRLTRRGWLGRLLLARAISGLDHGRHANATPAGLEPLFPGGLDGAPAAVPPASRRSLRQHPPARLRYGRGDRRRSRRAAAGPARSGLTARGVNRTATRRMKRLSWPPRIGAVSVGCWATCARASSIRTTAISATPHRRLATSRSATGRTHS